MATEISDLRKRIRRIMREAIAALPNGYKRWHANDAIYEASNKEFGSRYGIPELTPEQRKEWNLERRMVLSHLSYQGDVTFTVELPRVWIRVMCPKCETDSRTFKGGCLLCCGFHTDLKQALAYGLGDFVLTLRQEPIVPHCWLVAADWLEDHGFYALGTAFRETAKSVYKKQTAQ